MTHDERIAEVKKLLLAAHNLEQAEREAWAFSKAMEAANNALGIIEELQAEVAVLNQSANALTMEFNRILKENALEAENARLLSENRELKAITDLFEHGLVSEEDVLIKLQWEKADLEACNARLRAQLSANLPERKSQVGEHATEQPKSDEVESRATGHAKPRQ